MVTEDLLHPKQALGDRGAGGSSVLKESSAQWGGQTRGCQQSQGGIGGAAMEPTVPGQPRGRRIASVRKHPEGMGVPPHNTVTDHWAGLSLFGHRDVLLSSHPPLLAETGYVCMLSLCKEGLENSSGEEEVTLH